ncbi:hypothetical protein [Pseudomonas sp.]|nr:hypothetical protein [Pseudomonas sp.]
MSRSYASLADGFRLGLDLHATFELLDEAHQDRSHQWRQSTEGQQPAHA